MRFTLFLSLLPIALAGLLAVASAAPVRAIDKKILLIAGTASHGPGQHEHNAGVQLLAKCLAHTPGLKTEVVLNGWPRDPAVFNGVDAIILYCDGGANHIAVVDDHLAVLGKVLDQGVGLGLIHYAIEPTLEKGQAEFLRWVGGCFEIDWSVNPLWDAEFRNFPAHPVTRGVQPFKMRDEWYFNLRFVDGMKGVTPLLMAKAPPDTMKRRDGPHEGNPAVRAMVARGDRQTVSWAYERPGGGRGFGFSGAHFHANWGNDDFRKLVLNAIVWLAKMEVPARGIVSTVTTEDLAANLDPKG